ncbi:uncharacterized protein LOC144347813 [Saccoglossus kowalevskii]
MSYQCIPLIFLLTGMLQLCEAYDRTKCYVCFDSASENDCRQQIESATLQTCDSGMYRNPVCFVSKIEENGEVVSFNRGCRAYANCLEGCTNHFETGEGYM